MRKTLRWGYQEKEYDSEIEEEQGGAVWIENRFFSIYNDDLLPIGRYKLEWDGVPFWIVSFGEFSISFGKIGRWVLLKDSIRYKEEKQ